MYVVISEGIVYFIDSNKDTINDFYEMADEIFKSKNETSAIRRHLLNQIGILEEE